MSPKRIAAVALSGALLAGGTGVAIAAATRDEGKKAEQAVLDDAANRLDVTPQKLRDALKAAEQAQLDARLADAVKAGKLTQKQADEIKSEHQKLDGVLGGGGFGGPGGPGGPHIRGGGPGFFKGGPGVRVDIAKALGISRAKLHEQLRAGKSIADIAKAQGKSLADVRSAVKADAKARADKAVKAGDLTQDQEDKLLSHLDDMLAHLDEAPMLRDRRRHFDGPPPLDPKPGSFVPAPDESGPVLESGVFS
jgi:predicted transcriptional regulator